MILLLGFVFELLVVIARFWVWALELPYTADYLWKSRTDDVARQLPLKSLQLRKRRDSHHGSLRQYLTIANNLVDRHVPMFINESITRHVLWPGFPRGRQTFFTELPRLVLGHD